MPLAICATPIGNLEDVTLRVLAELREADLVLAEDTRHTRGLLDRHGIAARLVSYHEHNEAARVAEVLPRVLAGERVALVSDAGLPGISDPGGRLVRAALAAGASVTVLPGPSAVETALVASGLVFRALRLRRLPPAARAPTGGPVGGARGVVVADRRVRVAADDSAHRLRSLAGRWPEREVAVCRELTKQFEEIRRGTASELADRFSAPPRGEITLVVGPGAAPADPGLAADAVQAVADLVAAGAPRRAAADVVSRLTGVPRNELYRSSL